MKDGSVDGERLPEEAVDPLSRGERGSDEHGDTGDQVGESYCWDDGFGGGDDGHAIVGCGVVFEGGLNVLDEEVDGADEADAHYLVEHGEDGWSMRWSACVGV